jgi:glycerol-3-phosphate cytidylyltransferase
MRRARRKQASTVRVITYGTFDVLHHGHIRLLKRARAMGDFLMVGLSTDEFNLLKHKESLQPFGERKLVLESLRFVDKVIPEKNWEQKKADIKKNRIDILVMGEDWRGKFDDLRDYCKVVYVPRTKNTSSTSLRKRAAEKFIRSW